MNLRCLALTLILTSICAQGQNTQTAIDNAVRYLSKASLTWPSENHCFSCHNNGDAVRVLAQVAPDELKRQENDWQAVYQWLVQPTQWETAKTEEASLSPILAPIQFGSALVALSTAKLLNLSPEAINDTAQLIVQSQDPTGFWAVEAPQHLGSPGTFGNPLATTIAVRILQSLAPNKAAKSIERAKQWANTRQARANLDLAAGILLLTTDKLSTDAGVRDQQRVEIWTQKLINNQTSQGGWGPYPNRFPEIFDTALALLALCEAPRHFVPSSVLERGQRFLLTEQESAGGWPETTRPSGGTSYAQHISTSAWALEAVAATQQRLDRPEVSAPQQNKPSR